MNNPIKRFVIQTYNVGIILKNFGYVMKNGINKNDIIWLKHPYRDRFFADPFLIDSDDLYYYILCEELLFFEDKGKIALLIVKKEGFELVDHKVIIEEPFHLSFPYCKYKGTEIIPEASASGKSFRYTIESGSFKITQKEEILKEGLIDAVIYKDKNTEYLFATKHPNPLTDTFVYKSDGKGAFSLPGEMILKNDKAHARSAGDFFIWDGKLYRPVQDCRGRYGRQTIIEQIKSIENGYISEDILTLNSFENPPYNETMHTFNVYNECIIVDGSKDYMRFPVKLLYKKARFLFKNRKQ